QKRKLDLRCQPVFTSPARWKASLVRAQRINSAIVTCLEHVATSTAPPGAGAADFLLKLLDDGGFTLEEVDEITRRVSIILRGITERFELTQSSPLQSCFPLTPPMTGESAD